MSNKVNVINNAEKDVVVTVNNKDGNTQIVIDLAPVKPDLSKLKPGDVFKGRSGTEYILWYITEDNHKAILRKDLLDEDMKFGKDNNFDGSKIDRYLNTTYIKEIEYDFGAENIVEHKVDLLSLDGEYDYGIITRKVSIPTIDQYRGHKKTIGKNMDRAWFLATPDSTTSGCGVHCVRYVDSNGIVYCGWYYGVKAVRPFFEIS